MNDAHQFSEFGLSFDSEFVSTAETAEPGRPLLERRGFDLITLIEALPTLGTVLWLERREWRQLPLSAGATAQGVLVLTKGIVSTWLPSLGVDAAITSG